MRLWHYLQASLLLVCLCSSSQAALIAYEGFDYANGTDIQAQTGGTGWQAGWFGTDAPANGAQVQTGSALSYGSLQTTGLGLHQNYTSGATNSVSKTFRALSSNITSGTVWISFLMRGTDLDNVDTLKLTLYNSATGANEHLSIGVLTQTPNTNISIIPNNSGTAQQSTVSANSGTHFVAVRYSFTDGNIKLFVNPTLGGAEPIVADAQITATPLAFQSIRLENYSSSGTNIGSGSFDELRIGNTFADVAPVPEPSAFVLAFVGLGMLLRFRAHLHRV